MNPLRCTSNRRPDGLHCLFRSFREEKEIWCLGRESNHGKSIIQLVPYLQYKNVKCTTVQALRLCTGRTAHRGSRGIALLFYDHGARRGWGVSVKPRPLFTPGKEQVPIVQEAGWAPGPVWTGAENLALTGIRSPDRPARSYTDYATRPVWGLSSRP